MTSPGPAAGPAPAFAAAARSALADPALRRTLGGTAERLRGRRAAAAAGIADWEELRETGRAAGEAALRTLDAHLENLERAVTEAGGTVHWAVDAAEARRIVTGLVRDTGAAEAVRTASAAIREIGLDGALARIGVTARETARADGAPPPGRARLLGARVAVTGANFLVAETGTVVVLEPEGGARMCLTLPETLITVAGIDEVVPTWDDMEVFLQLLPPSSSGDRMTPYVSTWTGVVPGDGPRAFHLVLLDNGRTKALADEVGRAALRCIRCTACLHVCPVYERTGGGPYGPVHAGPIGAILTPQLRGVRSAAAASLPYASTLCGACADVCPVGIDIPEVLVHLRGKVVESRRGRPVPPPELVLMRGMAWTLGDPRRYEAAARRGARWARLLAKGGSIRRLPGLLGRWTEARDLPAPPAESFRAWWAGRRP